MKNTLTDIEPDKKNSPRSKKKAGDVEERLLKVERLIHALASNFPDVTIGVMDKNMQFLTVDRTLASTSTAEPLSKNYPSFDKQVTSKLKEAFNGENVNCEMNTDDKFYTITAIPLNGNGNKVEEVLCVIQNLTERKQMEQGLLNALEREKELGELKSRFVTMASHEFRTPLTSILASTFLLENLTGVDYEREKSIHTNRVKRSVNNLTTILNEFLSLQKLEENKVNVVRTNINIPEFIQDDLIGEMDVVKKVGQIIEYRHEGSQSMANFDHHLLWSIITNLLSNSLKYSRPGDKIEIVSDLTPDTFKLVVRDHGIGIPEDEHKHIFGRFYRARNALNIEGTGLGLHIVQKYVHLLNGTIAFDSRLDSGTTFTVTLPIVHSTEADYIINA